MRSHLRSRSPEGSFQGMPLSCTRRPGACPTMRTRALGHARRTGFGGFGRCASQMRQARTRASRRLKSAVLIRMLRLPPSAIQAPSMPHSPPFSQLGALSPLDGRYHKQLEPLRASFSEAALFRYRVAVEIRWLLALAAEPAIAEIKSFSKDTSAELERVIATFSEEDAAQVKSIEAETNHDVKAIEYWLKKRLAGNPEATRVAEFVHFACTSEDINNLAYGLMLKEGRDRVLLPALDRVIEPHDSLAEQFDAIARANTVLLDLDRDLWGYVSLGYFKQKAKAGEVGSSTMPHKVNPIDFENSEGNVGIANALLRHFSEKLPVSRWQRDLSDSTVLRNVGVALGHSLLAWESCLKGLAKLEADPARMLEDLEASWEVLAEAVQTVMRKHGLPDPYEQLKALTRGKRVDREAMRAFIRGLALPDADKARLLELTPARYTGKASELARKL